MTPGDPAPAPRRIFDGHNDALLSLHLPERGGGRSFFERGTVGHIDLPRALEGGFAGGFFALFTPPPEGLVWPGDEAVEPGEVFSVDYPPPLDPSYARAFSLALAARLFRLERESAGRLRIVHNARELEETYASGALAAILHLEGAEAIDPDLDALEVFYRAGLRSLGLVWSRANAFGCGVPFRNPSTPDTGPGLTPEGEKLVRACNQLGVMIDLSHLNEKGFWDVERLTEAPLVATHSSVHALCPSSRNLTDKQIDAIAASGGVIGINFCVADLHPEGRRDHDAPLEALVAHFRYIADRVGVDHVACGSDFDGAEIPGEIGDAAGLPHLVAALRAGGFNEDELAAIAFGNWLRVLRQTWRG